MQVIERKLGNRNSPRVLIFIVRIHVAQNDTRYKESGRVTESKERRTESFVWSASTTKHTKSHYTQHLCAQHSVKTHYLLYFSHITRKAKTCTKVVTCSANL